MKRYTNKEALRHCDSSLYRAPDGYTADIAVFTIVDEPERNKKKLKLLLIKRAMLNANNQPNIEAGKWALPGGFGTEHETAYQTAVRELSEETGVTGIHVNHFGVFDTPGRDPRGWVISNAHYAIVPSCYLDKRKAADDAEECQLFSIESVSELSLAFDHREIIKGAIERVRRELLQTTLAKYFLPEEFTLSELRAVLMTVEQEDPKITVKSSFWEKAPKLSFIELVTDENGIPKTTKRNGALRKTRLFRFNRKEPVASI